MDWYQSARLATEVLMSPEKLLHDLRCPSDADFEACARWWVETVGSDRPDRWLAQLPGRHRESLEKIVRETHDVILRRLQQDSGTLAAALILVADFGDEGGLFQLQCPDELSGPRQILIGCIDQLPAEHWLRSVEPPAGWCVSSGRDCIALGSSDYRSFYCLDSALALTAQLAGWRREQDRIRRNSEAREREQIEQARRLDPSTLAERLDEERLKRERLERELAELKAGR